MSSSPVQRAITEAIESIASTEARVSILVRALGRAGLARVPERGPEVLRFVEGPLVDAIVERLGTGVADHVVEQLRPILRFVARPPSVGPSTTVDTRKPPPAAAVSGAQPAVAAMGEPAIEPRPTIRVSDPAAFDRPVQVTPVPSAASRTGPAPVSEESGARRRPPASEPAPIASSSLPAASLFILASLDDALVAAVERLPDVTVRTVHGLFELVDAADDARDRTTTLVFDCSAPPVHIASLLALAADMPETVQVALLGASALDLQSLASAPERIVGWVYLDRPTAPELAELVGTAARA